MFTAYFERNIGFSPIVERPPHPQLGLCVVIPSYHEPQLRRSLESLLACSPPRCAVEVLVIINYPQGASPQVARDARLAHAMVDTLNRPSADRLRFIPILAADVPPAKAGVGLARRLGMDQAAWRLSARGTPRGIIACFDADSTCQPNYLQALEGLWDSHPHTSACSVRFEHPTQGVEFPAEVYQAITQYELHLRYYVQAARFVGHPFAYHTLGSSMACSAQAYLSQGGMCAHQAGEDFYFLHKFIPHGQFRELNTTCVYPSPRASHRVPFGTGRAIAQHVGNGQQEWPSYSFRLWATLPTLLANVEALYRASPARCDELLSTLDPVLRFYLLKQGFSSQVGQINANTSSPEAFRKRFFLWFDAFRLMKYLNFASARLMPRQPIGQGAWALLQAIGSPWAEDSSLAGQLQAYRSLQAQGWAPQAASGRGGAGGIR